jgi:flagellar basal body-associated protein FliL
MTEYIIIVVLVAVAAVGVYSFFGQTAHPSAPATAQEPGKAGKESAAALPAPVPPAKSEIKGADDAKSAAVTK